jgi:outer membrane protein insertion porin family
MFAKQTIASASLFVWLFGTAAFAYAEGDDAADKREGEARQPTGSFQIGAGFSSYEGFIGHARIEQTSLFGSGHALALDASISARRQGFVLDYRSAPLQDGLTLGAQLFSDRRLMPGFVREGNGGTLTLTKQVTRHLKLFAGLRLEHVSVEDTTATVPRSISTPLPLANGLIASLHAGFAYDSTDRPDVPTRGSTFGAIYESADRRLGSDFAFDRTRVWASHHQPIGALTLHVSGSMTQLSGGAPRSERLFLDDLHELRGFTPGTFGPIDGVGTPIGGMTKLTGRIELEVPLVRRAGLSVIGFHDVGALGTGSEMALGRSLGLGVLWRSPIGPMRFDWAVPLDGGGPPRFLFGLGGGW